MKTVRILGLLACVLLAAGTVSARDVSIRHTLDYTYNSYPTAPWEGYYFWHESLDPITDHPPFYRHMWEDWGWAHDLTGRAPVDANSVKRAVLSIYAYDVNYDEVDRIYVYNGTGWEYLGQLQTAAERTWSTTSFTLSAALRQYLLTSRQLHVYMDIDYTEQGLRLTLGSSTLEVDYTATGEVAQPDVAVHRFWSPDLGSHFYTISEPEKDWLIANWPHVWIYEGVAYHAFSDALDTSLQPIYRFWSPTLGGHFFTINEAEKDWLIANWPHAWTYEGIAYYAYPEGSQPAGTSPIYRFWSGLLGHHFYTISEAEKQWLIDNYSWTWVLEGVAWYAYQ